MHKVGLARLAAAICFVVGALTWSAPSATAEGGTTSAPGVHDMQAALALNAELMQLRSDPVQQHAILAAQTPEMLQDLNTLAQLATVEVSQTSPTLPSPPPPPSLPDLTSLLGGQASPMGIHCQSEETSVVGKNNFGTRLWHLNVYGDTCFNLGSSTFYQADFTKQAEPEFIDWDFSGWDSENRNGGVGASSYHFNAFGSFKFCPSNGTPPVISWVVDALDPCQYEHPGAQLDGNIVQPGDTQWTTWQCYAGNRCEGYTYGVLRWSTG